MEARIRYLSIVTEQPEALSHFYQTYFGMRELATSRAGDVSLTEGSFNLSLLKRCDGAEEVGLGHMGLAIGDIREVEAQLEEFAPGAELEALDGSPSQGEYRVLDPNGYAVHLSTKDFGISTDATSLPGIRHVALCEQRGDAVADFFTNVFGIRETSHSFESREKGIPNRFMTDGRINLAILADAEQQRARGEHVSPDHMREGVNHFGFGVDSYQPIVSRMPAEAEPSRRVDRPDPNQYRVLDPDGNHIDLRLGQRWSGER